MAVCLDYQTVYYPRVNPAFGVKLQITLALVLLALLAGKVWIKLACTDLGYELAGEREQTVRLDMERRELQLQRSVLTRPDLVAKKAHDRLGFIAAKAEQIRIIAE